MLDPFIIGFIIVFVLIILLANVIRLRSRTMYESNQVFGIPVFEVRGRGEPRKSGGSRESSDSRRIGESDNSRIHHHALGTSLNKYVRTLRQSDSVGTHELNQSAYTGGSEIKNFISTDTDSIMRRAFNATKTKNEHRQAGKKWDEFKTWDDMRKDASATKDYFDQRAAVLNHPNLDWSEVLAVMNPKLKENREYIGVAVLKPDGKTLAVKSYEASTTTTDDEKSDLAFAGVPSDLVMKYSNMPGLILFHTHPEDIRANPMPSSHDLSTAIYLGATSRFAACAVISRYGVLMHGLDWDAYKAINAANDWNLAALNLSHDVVVAHEAIRSWSKHTIADQLKFYARHRMLMFVFPSPEMVSDMRSVLWSWDLESPIDSDIILDHGNDIAEHLNNRGKNKTQSKSAAFASNINVAFD